MPFLKKAQTLKKKKTRRDFFKGNTNETMRFEKKRKEKHAHHLQPSSLLQLL